MPNKNIEKLELADYKQWLKDSFFIVLGIFSAAFGLDSFLLPNKFIDGGATGISLLIAEVADVPLYILIMLVNIPFVVLGYNVIGRVFAVKTAFAILGLALVLFTVDFPEITEDKLLVAVFGGFFLGAGIGLSVRGGSVLDGTEVLAIYLSRKLGTTIGDIIILINVLVFLAAAYLLSIETALYSMLTYLAASKTLDFVIEGIEEYTGVTIISDKNEEIRAMITEKLERGLTVYKAKGGYGRQGERNEYDVIFTVITRLEIRRLNIEITKIDPKAFVVMSKINDTRGGMIKKRAI
ncbi:YitT family protein [Maribacter antarcticus]|uniref:YitT family protein n=1 Tax=Maribacter antarcticus TaxID=505250 RepID=UPI0005610D90|nr:YitT family protein [Maribacter antarcticus]